jgi:hypothetical protein
MQQTESIVPGAHGPLVKTFAWAKYWAKESLIHPIWLE